MEILGFNHMTLSVRSLEESFGFYEKILGFKALMKSPRSAYFLAGSAWFCIEEDPLVRDGALPEYTHLAFDVAAENFSAVVERLENAGVKSFKSNRSEGNSFYFLDPNGHRLEIHEGSWCTRLSAYRENAPEDVEFFD